MNLQTFDFNESPVRVVTRDEQPWFVAVDVCRVLDLTNPSMACEGLDEDEKMTLSNAEGHSGKRGGAQSFNVVSESGLYALVFKSRKPEAKTFRKWVTAEVLPMLRQTGRYEVAGAACGCQRRTVRDDMTTLRGLLLSSAGAVQSKTLDVGRAQQVANLAARFLETIKMEGDAIGYEKVFELPSGEAGGGLLQASERAGAELLQGVPQRSVPSAEEGQRGLSKPPVCLEKAMGTPQSSTREDLSATLPRTANLGPEEDGCAAGMPRTGGGSLGAE